MKQPASRRDFLRATALAGAGAWALGAPAFLRGRSLNEKLNLAVVGVSGRGASDLQGVSTENIVALCDVDDLNLGKAAEKYPVARTYNDFRRMLEQKDIDGVVVGTTDHTHAIIAVSAMKLGKHVYCEKPLAHSVYEARVMAETAAQHKVVTQMGNQGHASDRLRSVVEIVRSGAIGPVREVLLWSSKMFSGGDRPKDTPPVPKNLHWDLWLGPAPERPYHPTYVPRMWRGWWDFGSGNYGDMGCHIFDAAYWALGLRYPVSVEAEGPPGHPESTPAELIVRYEFPARGSQPPVKFAWYDGHKSPPMPELEGIKLPPQGSLLIGDKGKLLFPHSTGKIHLLPQAQFDGFNPPTPTLPRLGDDDAKSPHHQEWIRACKTGGQAESNFAYGGALTETILAGLVAYRTGKKLDWDGPKMKAKNCPEAARFIRPKFRKGWEV